MEITARSELSRTEQWLFVLQGGGGASGSKQQQHCHGYWFMLGAEAKAMMVEMQRVIDGLLLEQVLPAACSGYVSAA